jgi:hypothetical protein
LVHALTSGLEEPDIGAFADPLEGPDDEAPGQPLPEEEGRPPWLDATIDRGADEAGSQQEAIDDRLGREPGVGQGGKGDPERVGDGGQFRGPGRRFDAGGRQRLERRPLGREAGQERERVVDPLALEDRPRPGDLLGPEGARGRGRRASSSERRAVGFATARRALVAIDLSSPL